jgi:hypothetical protein
LWYATLYCWVVISDVQNGLQGTSCSLKIKPSRSFEKSGNAHPATRLHMQEELNPQQHRCENLKTCSTLFHIHAIDIPLHIPSIFPSSCFTSTRYSPPAVSHPYYIPFQLFHTHTIYIPLQLFHIPTIFPSSCFISTLYSTTLFS